MNKYISFILDSKSFDYYDLCSENETFCMTYQETCDAISNKINRIVTPSIMNIRYWHNYIEDGYSVFLYKNGKKIEIFEGMKIGDFQLRNTSNLENLILNGAFE